MHAQHESHPLRSLLAAVQYSVSAPRLRASFKASFTSIWVFPFSRGLADIPNIFIAQPPFKVLSLVFAALVLEFPFQLQDDYQDCRKNHRI